MLERRQIQRVVDMALDEDAPFGDLTSQTLVPVHGEGNTPTWSRASRACSPVPRCSRSR